MASIQAKIECVRHSDNDIRVIFYLGDKVQRYRFEDFKTFYAYFQDIANSIKISFSDPRKK